MPDDIVHFTPYRAQSIDYIGLGGKPLTLVIDYYKGHKAYWITDRQGKRLTDHMWYDVDAVAEIVGNAATGS